jgi:hypothetical protein
VKFYSLVKKIQTNMTNQIKNPFPYIADASVGPCAIDLKANFCQLHCDQSDTLAQCAGKCQPLAASACVSTVKAAVDAAGVYMPQILLDSEGGGGGACYNQGFQVMRDKSKVDLSALDCSSSRNQADCSADAFCWWDKGRRQEAASCKVQTLTTNPYGPGTGEMWFQPCANWYSNTNSDYPQFTCQMTSMDNGMTCPTTMLEPESN